MSRASGPFRFVVSDLLREAGRRRAETIVAPVEWAVELSRLTADPPLTAEVTMEGASGGIFVVGTIRTEVEHICHRCTTPWIEPLEVSIAEMLGVDEGSEYALSGDTADLEPPIRDAVLLELPLAPICRPGCLGLCGTCGADLNTGACPGHEDETASPFAGLREMLEPQE